MLLAGARSDEVHPVFGEQVRRAAELLPRASVERLPGTHMAPLQCLRELGEHISRFAAAAAAAITGAFDQRV